MIDIKAEELKLKIAEKGISEIVLARKLWITHRTLKKIFAGQLEFKCWQIKKVVKMLSLNNDEIMFIFFDKKVS